MAATCSDCRFFEPRKGEKQGRCKANPPVRRRQLVAIVYSLPIYDDQSVWPKVGPDDSCGQHQPK